MEVSPVDPERRTASIFKAASNRSSVHRNSEGFTRCDLVFSLTAGLLILGVVLPALAGIRPANGQSQCISNLRRLMLATQLYARDNADYLPHPTWGSSMTGPEGWAYATENNGRLPNSPSVPIPFKRESQLPFRQIGQLWNYIQSGSAYECPDDLIATQPYSELFSRGRVVQITSYAFNGMTSGNGYSGELPHGLTYKLSRFLPRDILAMEPPEAFAFFFNDAGFHPREPATTRHGGFLANSTTPPKDWLQEGGSNFGCLDGSAEFMTQSTLSAERVNYAGSQRTRFYCFPWQ